MNTTERSADERGGGDVASRASKPYLVNRGLILFFFTPDKNRKCAELRDEERKRHPACTTLHARRGETFITASYLQWLLQRSWCSKMQELAPVRTHRGSDETVTNRKFTPWRGGIKPLSRPPSFHCCSDHRLLAANTEIYYNYLPLNFFVLSVSQL